MDLSPVAALIAVATPPFLLAYNHPEAYAKVQPWVSVAARFVQAVLIGVIGMGWYAADHVREPLATHDALVALIPPWWWLLVSPGVEVFLLTLLGMRLLDVTKREPK